MGEQQHDGCTHVGTQAIGFREILDRLMGNLDRLVHSVTISDERSHHVDCDRASDLTKTKPAHAIGDKPQVFLIVTNVAVFVVIPDITYVCSGAILIQRRLLEEWMCWFQ